MEVGHECAYFFFVKKIMIRYVSNGKISIKCESKDMYRDCIGHRGLLGGMYQ